MGPAGNVQGGASDGQDGWFATRSAPLELVDQRVRPQFPRSWAARYAAWTMGAIFARLAPPRDADIARAREDHSQRTGRGTDAHHGRRALRRQQAVLDRDRWSWTRRSAARSWSRSAPPASAGATCTSRRARPPSRCPPCSGTRARAPWRPWATASPWSKPGDRVILSFVPNCGHCHSCETGRPHLCDEHARTSGKLFDGTSRLHTLAGQDLTHMGKVACFAEYAVVPEAGCIPAPAGLDFPQMALIGCSVTTGVGAAVFNARRRARRQRGGDRLRRRGHQRHPGRAAGRRHDHRGRGREGLGARLRAEVRRHPHRQRAHRGRGGARAGHHRRRRALRLRGVRRRRHDAHGRRHAPKARHRGHRRHRARGRRRRARADGASRGWRRRFAAATTAPARPRQDMPQDRRLACPRAARHRRAGDPALRASPTSTAPTTTSSPTRSAAA